MKSKKNKPTKPNYLEHLLDGSRFNEVSERITSHLDAKSLGNCRLVNKLWKTYINNSKHWWLAKLMKPEHKTKTLTFKVEECFHTESHGQRFPGKRLGKIGQIYPEYQTGFHQASAATKAKSFTIKKLKRYIQICTDFFQKEEIEENTCFLTELLTSDEIDLKHMDFIFDFPINLDRLISVSLQKAKLETIQWLVLKSPALNTIWKAPSVLPQGKIVYLQRNWYHWACYNPDLDVLKYVVALLGKEGLKSMDITRKTVLHYACHYGTKEMVEYLINENLPVTAMDNRYWTIYHYACLNKDIKILDFLMSLPIIRNRFSFSVATLFSFACQYGSKDIVEYFLDNASQLQLDPNQLTTNHMPGMPLFFGMPEMPGIFYACEYNTNQAFQVFFKDTIRPLIDYNAIDGHGRTLLHVAANSMSSYTWSTKDSNLRILMNQKDIFQNLDLKCQDNQGDTPLHLTMLGAHKDRLHEVKDLLESSDDPQELWDISNNKDLTPRLLADRFEREGMKMDKRLLPLPRLREALIDLPTPRLGRPLNLCNPSKKQKRYFV